jgi:hypothetical protein
MLAALPFALTVRGQSSTVRLKPDPPVRVTQHGAITASYYANLDPSNISTFQGKAENQGYYVFALPEP